MPLPYTVDDPYLQDNLDELDKRTASLAAGAVGNPANLQLVTFAGTWSNFNGGWQVAACWKIPDGTVFLQGQITKPTAFPASAETMCVLPAGFRPSLTQVFPVIIIGNAGGQSVASVYVDLSGNVVYYQGISGTAANPPGFVALNGICFKAAI